MAKKVIIPNDILLDETAGLIRKNHTVTHMVRGNSMNPFLADRRDKVIIAPAGENTLSVGTLALACDGGGRYVLHRIIKQDGNRLLLMGDGNLKETEESSAESVLGVAIVVIRKNKAYGCSGYIWKIYSFFWVKMLPLRRYLLAVCRRANII
jgi:hypothetical protein